MADNSTQSSLFGWSFVRKKEHDEQPSFVPAIDDDGGSVVAVGGGYGTSMVDIDGSIRSEAELVTRYRDMALQPECDAAISDIINESISTEEENIVEVNLEDADLSDKLKKTIREEFEVCLNLLDFRRKAYDIYRRWYIDGRLYFHVIIDPKDTKSGIREIRYIDPRKIRKIREVVKKRIVGGDFGASVDVDKVKNIYYVYNDRGFGPVNKSQSMAATTGLKIAEDAILHTTSGVTDNAGMLVLSFLHKAIKPLNQLRYMEDALIIYRLARAPERRIWYIDIGNLPKAKAEQYVKEIMIKHKNRLVYDSTTGEIRDDRKFMCYTLDTKIPLLDGRTLTIEDIITEYNSGKLNWVYSCDPKNGKFVPGPISWAGITKQNSDVVRVTFDNGKNVICSPDHKFPVWNKGFIEAKDLAVGESLIPGYRRLKPITSNGKEYEQIYKNDTQTWEFTHKEITAWKDENKLREEKIYKKANSFNVVHHKNFNRLDNSPNNLVMMDYFDHWLYHTENQSIKYSKELVSIIKNLLIQRKTSFEILNDLNNNHGLIEEWCNLNSDIHAKNKNYEKFIQKDLVKIAKICGFSSWNKMKSNLNPSKRFIERTYCSKRGSDDWKHKLKISRKNEARSFKSWKIINSIGNIDIIDNLNEYCRNHGLNRNNIKGPSGSKGFKAEQLHNHKVVSVEFLAEKMTLAALTIDQNETYHSNHTYLLDAGVYTKNTMQEDYWLPRREGGKGTEVVNLPGGQNLGQMDDVLFFQKKLFQSLNVPINRLNSDDSFTFGRSTETTRDELKFMKFISRLRSRFSEVFTKMLGKQLILKGLLSFEEWQLIAPKVKYIYAMDTDISELKNSEMITGRLTLMLQAEPLLGRYYSHEWARKNILRQSEEDIMEQDKIIDIELLDPRWQLPAPLEEHDDNQEEMPPEEQEEDNTSISTDGKPPVEDDEAISKVSPTEKVRNAMVKYKLLKQKGGNKMPHEAKAFKSAAQTVGRNK